MKIPMEQGQHKEKGIVRKKNHLNPGMTLVLPFNKDRDRHNVVRFSDVEPHFCQRAVDGGHISLVCSHGPVERASRTVHYRACKREAAHQNVLRSDLSPRALALDEK